MGRGRGRQGRQMARHVECAKGRRARSAVNAAPVGTAEKRVATAAWEKHLGACSRCRHERRPPSCERSGCHEPAVTCRQTVWLCETHFKEFRTEYNRLSKIKNRALARAAGLRVVIVTPDSWYIHKVGRQYPADKSDDGRYFVAAGGKIDKNHAVVIRVNYGKR